MALISTPFCVVLLSVLLALPLQQFAAVASFNIVSKLKDEKLKRYTFPTFDEDISDEYDYIKVVHQVEPSAAPCQANVLSSSPTTVTFECSCQNPSLLSSSTTTALSPELVACISLCANAQRDQCDRPSFYEVLSSNILMSCCTQCGATIESNSNDFVCIPSILPSPSASSTASVSPSTSATPSISPTITASPNRTASDFIIDEDKNLTVNAQIVGNIIERAVERNLDKILGVKGSDVTITIKIKGARKTTKSSPGPSSRASQPADEAQIPSDVELVDIGDIYSQPKQSSTYNTMNDNQERSNSLWSILSSFPNFRLNDESSNDFDLKGLTFRKVKNCQPKRNCLIFIIVESSTFLRKYIIQKAVNIVKSKRGFRDVIVTSQRKNVVITRIAPRKFQVKFRVDGGYQADQEAVFMSR